MKLLTLIITATCMAAIPVFSQNKIVITEESGILTKETESILKDNLAKSGLEYTTLVDYKLRCEYYFGKLFILNNELILRLRDCNDRETGMKNLGSSILKGGSQEVAILISFAITDIIQNPKKAELLVPQHERESAESRLYDEIPGEFVNEHTSRYFFAPSAFNLREGELYYNTVYFFLHDVQYGINDHFSIGMGTTLAGLPFYITPKLSIPINERSSFAIGDMMIIGTWGVEFFGNLVYGIYTRGNYDYNFSLGAGFFSSNDNDLTMKTNSPVGNFSFLTRASDYIYFVSENYGFNINTIQNAYYDYYNDVTGEYIYDSEDFGQKQTVIYGLTGFRFINKNNDVVSWQVGLTYIIPFYEEVPSRYKAQYWNTYTKDGGSDFIAIPTISYTRKFGKKY